MMGFRFYLKHAVWDFVLLAVAAVSLTYTALNGFYVDAALQHSALPGVVCVLCVAVLFLVCSSKRFLVPGGIAYALAVVVACIAAAAATGSSVTADTEGNYLIFALVIVVTSTLCFLLSRTRLGCALLLIAGIFTCGWIEFFYSCGELAWALAFLLSAMALIVYKNFQLSAASATSVRSLSFPAGFAVSAGAVAVAVAVAALVWFAIIAPLNPSAADIKLVTEYRALETIQAHGTSSEYMTPDLSTTSDQTNDGVRTTDDLQTAEQGVDMPAVPLESQDSSKQSSGSFLSISLESLQDAFDFEANPQNLPVVLLVAILVPLLIIAYFLGRRFYRSKRLERIQRLEPAEQVRKLYLFLAGKLARVGFAIPPGVTPLEFGRNNSDAMERFDAEAGVSFSELCESYAAVAYGNAAASKGEAEAFAAYYRAFWKAARKQLGNVRYLLASFRL